MSRDEQRRARVLKAKKRRRRNRIIAYSLIVLVIAATGIALSLTVFFHIETIAVSGDEIYNNEQIIEASQIQIGDNMFLTRKKETAELIEKTLPYIEQAEIKRNISGTITISVTAAKPKMAIDYGDSFTLVSDKGKVLEDGLMTINDGIAVINASAVIAAVPGEMLAFENAEDLTVITGVISSLEATGITGVSSVDVTDHSNIKLVYAERITLELGMVGSIADKMDFIKATMDKINTDTPAFEGTIDFTIDKKAYLKPRASETTTLPPAETGGGGEAV